LDVVCYRYRFIPSYRDRVPADWFALGTVALFPVDCVNSQASHGHQRQTGGVTINRNQLNIVKNLGRRGYVIEKTPECAARQAAKLLEEVSELLMQVTGYPLPMEGIHLQAKTVFKTGECGELLHTKETEKEISDVMVTICAMLFAMGIDVSEALAFGEDKSSYDVVRGVTPR
jgi:hypothetical protein